MKIIKPSVTLVHCTPDPERVIERMGRVCYQSNHKVKVCEGDKRAGLGCVGGRLPNTAGQSSFEVCSVCNGAGTDIASACAFVKMLLASGHESVIEHVSAGFLIVTDRGVTHEIVRHRLASYSQESTRYCNYGKEGFGQELTVIEPPGLSETLPAGHPDGVVTELYLWRSGVRVAENIYLKMLSHGVAPQIARSVLPNSLKSEIGMTANFREWRHFLRLRTSSKAHPQMREIAEMLRAELLKISPVCFEDIP